MAENAKRGVSGHGAPGARCLRAGKHGARNGVAQGARSQRNTLECRDSRLGHTRFVRKPQLAPVRNRSRRKPVPRPAPALLPPFMRPASRVAIRRVTSYQSDIAAVLGETLREFDLPIRGKTVLLKPNLVGFDPLTL